MTFNGPSPTETAGAAPGQITTYDISGQYDLFSDFPTYPLNPFSLANAILGVYFVHAQYANLDPADAIFQDQVGDTAYYLIPTPRVPLLMPLALLGIPDPLLAILDAPVRVLVEAGYDRTISPGQPTPASFLPIANPLQTAANLAAAVPTGFDDGLQGLGLGRPLGTTAAGPYGVGGPPVTLPGSSPAPLTTLSAPQLSNEQAETEESSPSITKTEETQNIRRESLNFSPGETNSNRTETPNSSSSETTETTTEPVTTTPSTGTSDTTGTGTDAGPSTSTGTAGDGQSTNNAAA